MPRPDSVPPSGAGPEPESPDHLRPLLRRLRLDRLLQRFPPRIVRALYVFVNGFITIGMLGLLTLASRNPFVFPSLGPTAYLLFFSPLSKAASPRNTIVGHAIGLICGYAAFVVTGAYGLPLGVQAGVLGPKVLAAALSLSATGALMVLLEVSHPPAGATTLIVSLGILSTPRDLVIIEVAVFLLVVQAWVINRLAGLPYPLWNAAADDSAKSPLH
jgi:CBS domain-containing membrane protein